MNALAPAVAALSADEIDLMLETLAPTAFGRNARLVGRFTEAGRLARGLVAKGLGVLDASDWFSVSTEGARQLARLGEVTTAELASDVDRLLADLVHARRVYEAGLSDRSLGDLSWFPVRDEPFSRVAAAILLKRGLIETREPEGQQEAAWAAETGGLIARATDAGMSAR